MGLIEAAVLILGGINTFILLVKPVGRFHTRLDLIEYRLAAIEEGLDKMVRKGDTGST